MVNLCYPPRHTYAIYVTRAPYEFLGVAQKRWLIDELAGEGWRSCSFAAHRESSRASGERAERERERERPLHSKVYRLPRTERARERAERYRGREREAVAHSKVYRLG